MSIPSCNLSLVHAALFKFSLSAQCVLKASIFYFRQANPFLLQECSTKKSMLYSAASRFAKLFLETTFIQKSVVRTGLDN